MNEERTGKCLRQVEHIIVLKYFHLEYAVYTSRLPRRGCKIKDMCWYKTYLCIGRIGTWRISWIVHIIIDGGKWMGFIYNEVASLSYGKHNHHCSHLSRLSVSIFNQCNESRQK